MNEASPKKEAKFEKNLFIQKKLSFKIDAMRNVLIYINGSVIYGLKIEEENKENASKLIYFIKYFSAIERERMLF